MRLLVSVASAAEASAALAGGADIIDAKNPFVGALGAVCLEVFRAIQASVAGARPVTAAIGDGVDETITERTACTFAAAGAALVKVGFAGVTSAAGVEAMTSAARRGARMGGDGRSGVIAVAYADAHRVGSVAAEAVIGAAVRGGATGVLLDTADKGGPGLRELLAPDALAAWVARARAAGLLVALAGKLTADDLSSVREAGADIAGVRGAACEGDARLDRVSAVKVRLLRSRCDARPERDAAGVARPTA
jgi:uncharacterized protein (UPF0264 family)